jgi:hypothetical protein
MKVVIDYKFENINTYINRCRTNYFIANKIKQKETELSRFAFINIPKITNYPIELIFTWHIKTKTADLDGKLPKNIIDGLVRSGKIIDDNVKYIQKITHIYEEDKKEYVEIEIKALNKHERGENDK